MPFILRRMGFYVVADRVALTVNFFLQRAAPGDAVEAIMSKFPSFQPAAYRALEPLLGVGHTGPLWHQYVSCLDDVVLLTGNPAVSKMSARRKFSGLFNCRRCRCRFAQVTDSPSRLRGWDKQKSLTAIREKGAR
jgi:ABC-type dipeptide/oligopeptide/nickel transport system permease component